jgi:hypothetical protein
MIAGTQQCASDDVQRMGRADGGDDVLGPGLPLVEDNPYGELWFDAPPPLPLAARNPEG